MRGVSIVVAICVVAAAARDARADAKKDVTRAVKAQVAQFFADDDATSAFVGDAELSTAKGGIVGPKEFGLAVGTTLLTWGMVRKATVKNLAVGVLGDGAWASFTIHLAMYDDSEEPGAGWSEDVRATEVLMHDEDQDLWLVVAAQWSEAVSDEVANRSGKQEGGFEPLAPVADADSGVTAITEGIVADLRKGVIAADVSGRADVAVYGTDAVKPRRGGKATTKAWKAWWKAVEVDGAAHSRLNVAETGRVASVLANLTIKKGKGAKAYTIPARVFLVVIDEKGDGAWRVVAAQISVP